MKKKGYSFCVGGILNAFRDKNLSFNETQIALVKFFMSAFRRGCWKYCLQDFEIDDKDMFEMGFDGYHCKINAKQSLIKNTESYLKELKENL